MSQTFFKKLIMKKVFLIIIFSIFFIEAYSCCAARQYKLFPMGESNGDLIFVEFNLFRYCSRDGMPGMGENNEFWWKGTVNLVSYSNNSLIFIQNIDTVEIKECICTYKTVDSSSNYQEELFPFYQKALSVANHLENFTIAKTINISFNNNLDIEKIYTDTSYTVKYKVRDTIIDIGDMISCYPENLIESRNYETENYKITIIRLSCTKKTSDKNIESNTEYFKNINTAFWGEQVQWHSVSNDYYFITKKTNK
jgi:hypothetical protein